MRASLLIACAALPLSACGDKDAAQQSGNARQDIAAESIAAGNDMTAIDAATSADANMAADVEFDADLNNLDENAQEAPAGNAD